MVKAKLVRDLDGHDGGHRRRAARPLERSSPVARGSTTRCWSESSAADPEHDLGALVAYAADGEPLRPGDLLATGTLPGGCGLELDRWVKPGDTVTLELDGVGSVSNRAVRP